MARIGLDTVAGMVLSNPVALSVMYGGAAPLNVAAFLLGLRDQRRRLGGGEVLVPLPMTRTDIADDLGLTIETVSRTISRLARTGALVVVPGGVRLLDTERLRRLAAM